MDEKELRDTKGTIMVTVKMPEETFEFLVDTLKMDAKSSSFDPELREHIRQALTELQVVEQATEEEIETARGEHCLDTDDLEIDEDA